MSCALTETEKAAWSAWYERNDGPRSGCGDAEREAKCAAWTPPTIPHYSNRAPWEDCYPGDWRIPCRILLEKVNRERRTGAVGIYADGREKLAHGMHIPVLFWQNLGIRTPPMLDQTDAVKAVRAFGRSSGILCLGGPTGSGKSIAATEWLWRYWRGESIGDWPNEIRATFTTAQAVRRANWFDEDVVRRILVAPALVLDDLGAEQGDSATGTWAARLDEIVSVRHAGQRPLVITTNLPEAELWRLLGDRCEDRIEQVRYVACVGESRRRQKKAKETSA